ncbi:MAG: sigma-54 factor interaction protein, partial [Gemmatimonadetes bacterium]|nr:sigma-54 factor interaction protein [Gemmatimonadota bacterium]
MPSTAADAPRILIADDQPDVLEALRLLLKGEGFRIETATSPAGIVAAVRDKDLDVVLMDLNYARDTTSGREGLDLLHQLGAVDATLPVVVMTAWGSVDGAVEAMRRGARDYVEKPWDNARLVATLRSQVELGHALRRTQRLEQENLRLRPDGLPRMIAESRAMQPVLRMMERVGPSDAAVLITGEHGTGKDVVARWLHASSARAARPLVTVNAGAIADGVFESELFGHVKGAFTGAVRPRQGLFEDAKGGTFFFDEIAETTPAFQAKLLRVIQEHEIRRVGDNASIRVDVRVIAATNQDLRAAIADR